MLGFIVLKKLQDTCAADKASQYIYSSASNYVSDSGLLTIEKADIPVVDVLNLHNFTKYNQYWEW